MPEDTKELICEAIKNTMGPKTDGPYKDTMLLRCMYFIQATESQPVRKQRSDAGKSRKTDAPLLDLKEPARDSAIAAEPVDL